MRHIVTRVYGFSAAHHLHGLPEGHKCERPHGHNYRVEVAIAAPALVNGMVMEAGEIDRVMAPAIASVDHRDLNEVTIPSVSAQPTAENIAAWLFVIASDSFAVDAVRVWENERLCAEVRR